MFDGDCCGYVRTRSTLTADRSHAVACPGSGHGHPLSGGEIMAKTTLESLIGSTARDAAGVEIGRIKSFFLDDESGAPTWAAVSMGRGEQAALAPLAGAEYRPEDNSVRLRVNREMVSTAPHLDHDGRIDPQAEQQLIAHYGGGQRRGAASVAGTRIQPAMDEPMTHGYGDAESLLRSEERLVVNTDREEVGTARLHKYVVEEEQTVSVPVSHEEVRVVREPITDPSAAGRADIGEAVQEVTLHADRVRMDTEAVPVERVRLEVEDVAGEQAVSGTVRKERFETEGFEPENPEKRGGA
ncbi:YsnF/AvaK domain-containing protein [Nocardia sp. NPDC058058]|uniref:YsnF/AvaK domain-containing protein n=1 Tax=Nocardia sp. NPDC058058 TaxID=3346317 RepID=UPI0036D9A96E